MRCKHCNIEIYGKADFCPLCKQPLEKDGAVQEENKNYVYPIKKKRNKAYKILKFTPLYTMIAGFVFMIITIVNLLLAPEQSWYLLVGVILLYVYILVENTILSRNSIFNKIIWQTIMVFAIMWVMAFELYKIEIIEDVWEFLFNYSLPLIVGVSNIVMCILTGCFLKIDKGLIVDVIWFSILGFLPLILYGAIFKQISYYAVAVSIISIIQIIVFSIIGRKHIKKQGKLKYHA